MPTVVFKTAAGRVTCQTKQKMKTQKAAPPAEVKKHASRAHTKKKQERVSTR